MKTLNPVDVQHTPGPWEVDSGVVPWHGGDVPALAIWKQFPDGRGTPVAWVHPYLHLSNHEADACLIAAAPDMLEALENLENDADRIPEHAWKLVQAAIAKARGRS